VEARFTGELFLQCLKVATGEVQHRATLRADEVVMVLAGTAQKIAPGMAFGMDFTNEAQSGEHIEGAINSNKRDVGVLTARFFEELGRGKMRAASGYYLDEMTARRSKLITPLAQDMSNPLFSQHNYIPN
jgi:hypothetical protein